MKATKLLIGLALCCAFLSGCGAANPKEPVKGLVGNFLRHTMAAPDFALTDQNGATFHMAAMKGKVVLLSFIYTHCTDICPYIAVKEKIANTLLGGDAANVVLVAVTTDPKRDVPKVTAAYCKELGLDGLHFLSGDPKAVQAVWFDYGIGVTVDQKTDAVAPKEGAQSDTPPTQGLSSSDIILAGTLSDKFGGGYDVGHSAPFWIVDKKGVIQVGMDADATPTDLVKNIRTLLAQK